MHINIFKEIQRLDNLFKVVSRIEDDELKSHWAKYLCILVSGLIENSIRISLSNYVSEKSSPVVFNYIENHLKKITNLNSNKIEDLLNLFNNEWGIKFTYLLKDEQKTAIDSVVANRHQIAHGINIGLSYAIMNNYYLHIKAAINHFELIIT